jgi:hypothetical protein
LFFLPFRSFKYLLCPAGNIKDIRNSSIAVFIRWLWSSIFLLNLAAELLTLLSHHLYNLSIIKAGIRQQEALATHILAYYHKKLFSQTKTTPSCDARGRSVSYERPEGKGQRTGRRGPKPRGSEGLLAATERELLVQAKRVVRIDPVRAQPALPVVAAFDVEDTQTAVGVGDGVHGRQEPLPVGLLQVGQARQHRVLAGQLDQPLLRAAVDDLLQRGVLDEAQRIGGDDDDVHFGLLGGEDEALVAHHALSVFADLDASLAERTQQRIHVRELPSRDPQERREVRRLRDLRLGSTHTVKALLSDVNCPKLRLIVCRATD